MEQEMEDEKPSLVGGSVKAEEFVDDQANAKTDLEGQETERAVFDFQPDSVKSWVQGRMSQHSRPSSSVATWDGVLGSDLFRSSRASSVRNIGGVDMNYHTAEEEIELKFQEQAAVRDLERLKAAAEIEDRLRQIQRQKELAQLRRTFSEGSRNPSRVASLFGAGRAGSTFRPERQFTSANASLLGHMNPRRNPPSIRIDGGTSELRANTEPSLDGGAGRDSRLGDFADEFDVLCFVPVPVKMLIVLKVVMSKFEIRNSKFK